MTSRNDNSGNSDSHSDSTGGRFTDQTSGRSSNNTKEMLRDSALDSSTDQTSGRSSNKTKEMLRDSALGPSAASVLQAELDSGQAGYGRPSVASESQAMEAKKSGDYDSCEDSDSSEDKASEIRLTKNSYDESDSKRIFFVIGIVIPADPKTVLTHKEEHCLSGPYYWNTKDSRGFNDVYYNLDSIKDGIPRVKMTASVKPQRSIRKEVRGLKFEVGDICYTNVHTLQFHSSYHAFQWIDMVIEPGSKIVKVPIMSHAPPKSSSFFDRKRSRTFNKYFKELDADAGQIEVGKESEGGVSGEGCDSGEGGVSGEGCDSGEGGVSGEGCDSGESGNGLDVEVIEKQIEIIPVTAEENAKLNLIDDDVTIIGVSECPYMKCKGRSSKRPRREENGS